MSMHKKPLTDIERKGLEQHGLPVGTPSQLADSFRLGFAWALAQQGELVGSVRQKYTGNGGVEVVWRGGKAPAIGTDLYTAAPAPQAQQEPVSALGIAGIGLKHFGNPIPRAWYSAAKELMLAAAPAPQAQQRPVMHIPQDFHTHKYAWLTALQIARDNAEVSPPDIDDKAYWEHEIRAFQRAYAELEEAPHPDTRTVVQQMVDALQDNHQWHVDHEDYGYLESELGVQTNDAIAAGHKLLKELKP